MQTGSHFFAGFNGCEGWVSCKMELEGLSAVPGSCFAAPSLPLKVVRVFLFLCEYIAVRVLVCSASGLKASVQYPVSPIQLE